MVLLVGIPVDTQAALADTLVDSLAHSWVGSQAVLPDIPVGILADMQGVAVVVVMASEVVV